MPSKYDSISSLHQSAPRIPAAKVVAWVEQNFDFKTRKEGTELLICNPFNGDTSFKMNINPEKLAVHCWTGNEWAGKVNPETGKRNCSFINFVKLFKKCSYPEAIRAVLGAAEDIKAFLRPEARHSTAKGEKKIAMALPEGTEQLINATDKQSRILIPWLRSRGYSLADIEKNDLHYLGMEVFWPYYEFDILVMYQSRSRLNKRFNFPSDIYEGTKGDFFYGFDDAEMASYLIITEAIFDQHTLGEQALASGGAILTPRQIEKLKILGPRKGVILAPDNDSAGIESIISNYKLLKSCGYPIFFSIPPRVEYVKEGKKRFTKDFNEFVQYLNMSREDVRKIHDAHITKLSISSLMQLHSQISKR